MSASQNSVELPRAGTANVDEALQAREERKFLRLDQKEFTKRQRYKDSNGVSYAPALATDVIYAQLRRGDKVDKLEPDERRGLPRPLPTQVSDGRGTLGALHGRVLLHARMPSNGKIGRPPKGQVTFTDPATNELFTGEVYQTQFIERSKTGWVILTNVVGWGRMSDPSQFPTKRRRRRKRTHDE